MDSAQMWLQVGALLLGSGVITALINRFGDRWIFKQTRKNQKEDEAEKKNDRVEELAKEIEKVKSEEEEAHLIFAKLIEEFKKSEDEKNAVMEKQIAALKDQSDSMAEALKVMMLDRIVFIGKKYIAAGEITYEDRHILHQMHEAYHQGLNGNGDADWIMQSVDKLRLVEK